jgi:hypothetical protein
MYQFSLLAFSCLACLCAGLCSRTLVYTYTPYPTWCVDLSTYVILFFLRFHSSLLVLSSRTNHFFWFFYQSFQFPLPRVLSLTFHFSLYSSTFQTSFSQLASSACFLFFVWPLVSVVVRVSWTEGERARSRKDTHAEYKQVSAPIPAKGPVSAREIILQLLYLPPFPRCGRDHKPNGPFRLRAVVITDPSLRPLLKNTRGRNHKPNVL